MAEEIDFYRLLGVPRRASTEQIQQAYHEIARVYHPDSNFYDEILGEAGETAVHLDDERFKRLTEAYNTLMNNERRQAYDATLPPELRAWDDADQSIGRADVIARLHDEQHRTISGAFGRFGTLDSRRVREESTTTTVVEAPNESVFARFLKKCGL